MQNYVILFKYKYDYKNFILCYIIILKSMILIHNSLIFTRERVIYYKKGGIIKS